VGKLLNGVGIKLGIRSPAMIAVNYCQLPLPLGLQIQQQAT
jgi:hypothetical protein